jgi:glycosyltransferase involved in cell wall biosynthesis
MSKKNLNINVFTYGDSNDVKVFSGLPYYFTKSLEKKADIKRIDISYPLIEKFYNNSIRKIINFLEKIIFGKKSTFNFMRSKLCQYLANKKIKKAIRNNSNADYNLFLTYSFSSYNFSKIPTIAFSDAVYEQTIKYFQEREPIFFEKYAIRKETEILKNSDIVIAFFPKLKKELEKYYNKNTYYSGTALNIELPQINDVNDYLLKKQNSNDIIFSGRESYIEGAKILISAFLVFNEKYGKKYNLSIVGIDISKFGNKYTNKNIKFYNYLDKSNKNELNIYMELMKNAKLFINPTHKGGTFITTLEVMSYYTPIMIFPYEEFKEVFPNYEKLGVFLESENEEHIAKKMELILNDNDLWIEKSKNCRKAVENLTWDNFTERFLNLLK